MNASVDDVREFVAESREAALALAESFFRTSAPELETWVVPPSVHISGLGRARADDRGAAVGASAPRDPRRERAPSAIESASRDGATSGRGERREARRPRERSRAIRAATARARIGERGGRARANAAERSARARATGTRAASETRERPREEAPCRRAQPPSTEPLTAGRLGPVGEFVTGILERMKVRDVVGLGGRDRRRRDRRHPRRARRSLRLPSASRAWSPRCPTSRTAPPRRSSRATTPRPRSRSTECAARRARRLASAAAARAATAGDRGRDSGVRGERGGGRAAPRPRGPRHRRGRARAPGAGLGAHRARHRRVRSCCRPMNSRERWFVHNALKDERGVRSESEGEGARKRVRIFPA